MYTVRSNYEQNKDLVDEKLSKIVSKILYKKLQPKEMDEFIKLLQNEDFELKL